MTNLNQMINDWHNKQGQVEAGNWAYAFKPAPVTKFEPKWGSSGKDVYERTYQRTLPDGSKETWSDTVRRVVEGNIGLVDASHIYEGEKEKLIDLFLNFKALPAGRHLWASGVPGNQYLINCFVSHWTDTPSDHFQFSFLRAMEGGGVGTNYSSKYLPEATINNHLEVHVVCDSWHPDYEKMQNEGVLSKEYGADWTGAYEIEDSREGWAEAIVDLIDTFFRNDVKHTKRVYDVTRVRPAGARLKSFGGTASGPAPLAIALKELAKVLSANQSSPLSPLVAMELDHILAQCVVAGGVRRTARMSIVEWDDDDVFEFIKCKTDHRSHWTTNISVGVDQGFFTGLDRGDEWAHAVMENVSAGMLDNGEPGFVNLGLARETDPDVVSCNPCFPADTRVLTTQGYRTFGELYKTGEYNQILQDNRVSYHDDGGAESPEKWVVDSGSGATARAASPVFLTQQDADIVKVTTREGFSLRLTPDHLVATPTGMVAAEDLKPEQKILVALPEPTEAVAGQQPNTLEEIEHLLMGLIAGDGTIAKGKLSERAIIDLWDVEPERVAAIEGWLTRVHEEYRSVYLSKDRRPFTAFTTNYQPQRNKVSISSSILAAVLKNRYGFCKATKHQMPEAVLASARGRCALFYLAGLYFTDGTVGLSGHDKKTVSVRLSQSNPDLLRDVQLVLQANGVYSTVYLRRKAQYRAMPDGKGGLKDYWTKANFELIVGSGRDVFAKIVGFWLSEKDLKLASSSVSTYKQRVSATVVSVQPDGKEDVYCLREDEVRTLCANGITVRRCGEQFLSPWDSCNLGHINLSAFPEALNDMYQDNELFEAHGLMARFLVRATFGDKTDPKQAKTIETNRRIGVGHFGFAGFLAKNGIKYSECTQDARISMLLMSLQKFVREHARAYAYELRIPEPLKTTTVAPTGSIAKLPGATEGIHPVMYKYFTRRIRFSTVDPRQSDRLEEFKRDGFKVESDLYAANTAVVEIPSVDPLVEEVRALGFDPDEVVEASVDLTAEDMLRVQVMYQQFFADNAVSYTVNIPQDAMSVDDLVGVLKAKLPLLKGVTLFPAISRPQAPYEEMTKDQYEASQHKVVADSVDEECSTGACPIR